MSLPRDYSTTLTTRFSYYVLAVATLLAVGIAESDQRYILLGVSMVLLGVFLRGFVEISLSNLSKLRIDHYVKGFLEGDEISVSFIFNNRSIIPILFAEVLVDHTKHLKRVSNSRFLVNLLPKSALEIKVVFIGRVGTHRIGPVKIVLRDPLGLYRTQEIVLYKEFYVRIYPKTTYTILRRIYSYARSIGLSRSREAGEGVEFRSVRDYRPGDDMRRIVWKIYARTGRLVVKEMEKESSLKILYLIIASEDMFKGVYGSTPYEQIARVISAVSRYVASRSDLQTILMLIPSGLSEVHRFARGHESHMNILKILSSINYEAIFVSSSPPHSGEISRETIGSRIDLLIKKITDLISREKTLIMIFTDPIASSVEEFHKLISFLRGGGHKVIILIPLRSLYDIGSLKDLPALLYRIKILDETRREEELIRRFRSMGISTVALRPEQMIQSIVAEIETFRY
ncbi:MAG: DUF58 domain-containing protein [Sulfolobales archaeon]